MSWRARVVVVTGRPGPAAEHRQCRFLRIAVVDKHFLVAWLNVLAFSKYPAKNSNKSGRPILT
jgi:hypothetical protein